MKLNGSQILMECLLEQGVDTVFGFPGGAVLNIYDALYEQSDKINHILTAHEQGAAHAADGYARATGRPGVVIATSGPGATNLVTGIATAYMDSVPLIAITGNVASPLLGKDSFQEVDIAGITMPITKHNFIVKDVTKLAETIRRAFEIATSGRPGPVLVDIPKDITAAICEYEREIDRKKYEPVHKWKYTDEDIKKAAVLLNESHRPMVYFGGGVITSCASEELLEFADKTGCVLCSSFMGLGGFPSDDKRFTGMVGMHGSRASALAVQDCDLFIAIGARFSDRVIGNATHFAKNAKTIHIDIDPAEVNKNIITDMAITGDIKEVLSKLNACVKKTEREDWQRKVYDWKVKYPVAIKDDGSVTPQYVLKAIKDIAGENTIITTDVGQHQMWTAQFYGFDKPRTFISSGGLGTMGFGLGAAIGAKTACPDKTVFDIAGDGSFHMNMAEISTAVRYNIPVVVLIMNNGVLGMVRQWQKMFYSKRYSQTTLNRKTDFVKLAEAMGAKGYRITKKSDVEKTIKAAIEDNCPVVIDCVIDKDINVLPMVPSGGAVHDQIMEID